MVVWMINCTITVWLIISMVWDCTVNCTTTGNVNIECHNEVTTNMVIRCSRYLSMTSWHGIALCIAGPLWAENHRSTYKSLAVRRCSVLFVIVSVSKLQIIWEVMTRPWRHCNDKHLRERTCRDFAKNLEMFFVFAHHMQLIARHYIAVIMTMVPSQITSLTSVYSIIY